MGRGSDRAVITARTAPGVVDVSPRAIVSVAIEHSRRSAFANPAKLFDAPSQAVGGTRRYDVSPDGRFVFLKNDA
jgi:hypothetical protein